MYYVYRKRDGRILSASAETPIIRAGGACLVTALDQVVPPQELASWRIKNNVLQKVRLESPAKLGKRKEEREQKMREDNRRFLSLVNDPDISLEKLQEALQILGRVTFPRG